MRFCEFCGTALPERAQFCGRCGQFVSTTSTASGGNFNPEEVDWLLDERPTVQSQGSHPRIEQVSPYSTLPATPEPPQTPPTLHPDQLITLTNHGASDVPDMPTEIIPGFFDELEQRE